MSSPATPVRYAALSYCWGGYREYVTLSTDVAARHQSIDVSNLPQTLKDALFFARKLDLDYIWIDSLCIVQDDREEWSQQAALMANIYSSAYVVLAATRAKDATKGFLQPHQTPYIFSHANHPFNLYAQLSQDPTLGGAVYLDHTPVFQRGWYLQETLLATPHPAISRVRSVL